MDKIIIEGLELFCNHGVFPEENRLGQKFVVSAVLYTDTRKAGKTDDLSASIHYGEAALKIKEWMEGNTFALIERAAEYVCEQLLLHYPLLKQVTLKLEKPWAPVGLPLKTVGVEITRGWHEVYLSIGSNMGDKEGQLRFAIDELNAAYDTEVVKVSDFIVTEPYGYTEQDEFLNGCLKLKTLKTPYELLDFLHEIEKKAGRERKIHWGPRTLDLDILFYDKLIMEEDDLIIPHKEIEKRQFVLEPLVQIAQNFVHPLLNMSIEKLYANLTKK
ncbi:MAG: 2-amino-4-hydroxy-6-hydroxymethyldihydropteridine diphosphokinase [Lachnospiraceae bacterium]|nr:2-amino-4-hydroxy-6-hydroxymethyldihydropteridine diphosphokinase [Lachnospiraceae bacterium]